MSIHALALRQRTLARVVIAGVAVTAIAACTNLTEANPITNRYGSVSIRARNAPANRASANATVILFEAFTAAVPNSALQQNDQCLYSQVDTTTAVVRGVKKAGAQVTLGIAGTDIALPYDETYLRYANAENTPFSYASGDQVQISIPGDAGVFPAATIGVRLAEPILPGPVSVPTGTTPMTFTWNAGTDSTSSIILALRYANPATSAFANEQIYCALRDDGAHQLPTTALAAFLASPNEKRVLQITRWRTRETLIDSRTILHVATSVDTTITFRP